MMPIPETLRHKRRAVTRWAWAPPPPMEVLEVHHWLSRFMVGAAIVEDHGDLFIELLLSTPILPSLDLALRTYWDVNFRFFVTGPFRFAAGSGRPGSEISM